MKTYRQVIFDRIDQTSEETTDEHIQTLFGEMIADSEGDEELTRHNLGYILGYYDKATRERWYAALPKVNHPVFGYDFGRGKDPTPEEALNAGRQMAERQ